ncbi:MAG: SDR family oxidoreductase, partial [Actinomycetota bacterium]
CEAVAAEVTQRFDVEALPVACHVGHWDQVEALAERAYAEFGSVEVLVNNAGMSPPYPAIVDVTEELYDKVLDVNLKGPFRLAAVIGARMAAGDGGSIINVSSVAAVAPTPAEAPYGAAKAGLNNLTRSFAREYGPKVRVNCIMPGPFLTDIAESWDLEAFAEAAATNMALGRGGRPEEVVGAALYFASDASSFTTGAILRIDGGLPG